MAKKRSSKKVALPPLEPVRALQGEPCASGLAEPEEAARLVAHGWQQVGTSKGRYVLIADAEAEASSKGASDGEG